MIRSISSKDDFHVGQKVTIYRRTFRREEGLTDYVFEPESGESTIVGIRRKYLTVETTRLSSHGKPWVTTADFTIDRRLLRGKSGYGDGPTYFETEETLARTEREAAARAFWARFGVSWAPRGQGPLTIEQIEGVARALDPTFEGGS